MLLWASWEEYKVCSQADLGSSLGSTANVESFNLPELQFINNSYNLLYTSSVPGIVLRAFDSFIKLI